jgi:uracil-DNA glycosylase family 4
MFSEKGDPNSPVVFVGEAPGEEEDKLKRPFVGKAGTVFKQSN